MDGQITVFKLNLKKKNTTLQYVLQMTRPYLLYEAPEYKTDRACGSEFKFSILIFIQ